MGICAKLGQSSSQELRRHLDDFISKENIPMEGAQLYSHVLPSPQAQTIRGRRIAGRNWALAGDAAACVDPITGEGLYYALRSGDLLAQALADGQPQAYPERLRAAFSAYLEFAANIARKVFRGTFLGGAITTRMVQLINYSPTFRDLMRDVFSGSQEYRGLETAFVGPTWNYDGGICSQLSRSTACARSRHPRTFLIDGRRKSARVVGLRKIRIEKNRSSRMDSRPTSIHNPPAVLSTPAMIGMMEIAAAQAVQAELPAGAITVGTRIEVDHLKAVPEGTSVRATARRVEHKGRFMIFEVEAIAGEHVIGRGRVYRAIVEPAKFHAKAHTRKS